MSELVTYEQAEKLKKFGFNYKTEYYYKHTGFIYTDIFSDYNTPKYDNKRCSVPTVSDALDFIREKYQDKGIYISVKFGNGCGKPMYYGEMQDYSSLKSIATSNYNIYPEAENALLNAVLEYLEKEGSHV